MPPLKNIKHEQLAHNVLTEPSPTKAYQKTYNCEYSTAKTNSSEVLAKTDVRSRIQELMRQKGLSEGRLIEKLNEHVDSNREMISLEATKTGFRLFGAFDDSDKVNTNMQNIQINVSILNPQNTTNGMGSEQ